MPPRHPKIAEALGRMRATLADAGLPELHGARVLVAWSAGPDSAALVGLLQLVAPAQELDLHVAHLDHGLRPESRDEAALVQRHCDEQCLPLTVERLQLEPGPGLAARARDARRAALVGIATRLAADHLALGHTATDQAETVLMNLARGAGLTGLAGMSAVGRDRQGTTIIRPLLDLSRAETRQLAGLLGVPFVDDPTNADPQHLRVRVRSEVLPVLRARNPGADRAVAASARAARDAAEAVETWASREVERRRLGDGGHDLSGLGQLPRAVRTRALRDVCLETMGDPDALPRAVVEGIDRALAAGGGARSWDLQGFRVSLEESRLRIEAVPAPAPPGKLPNH